LAHGADVARAERVGVARLLALRDEQRADALLAWARVFSTCVSWLHDALVDAEEVDAPGERVGLRLEDVGEQLGVRVGLERDLGQLERAVLDRRREVLDDRVEQAVRRRGCASRRRRTTGRCRRGSCRP
jgi:hypothetical protein